MRDPRHYFSDPLEAELAAEAWTVGGATSTDPFFTWFPPHEQFLAAVETPFQRRVITARNWITAMRDQPGPWGDSGPERVTAYFKQQHGRDVRPTHLAIANVEHFYTSAFIAAVSGSFYAVPLVGVVGYEVLLQPVVVGLRNLSIRRAWDNFVNGWRQLAGPDAAGVKFILINSNFSAVDVQQFLSVEPEVVDSVPLPTRQKPAPRQPSAQPQTLSVKPGQSLSLIAKDLYRSVELWPLLWDMNRAEISNPNRVAVGARLRYRELASYSAAELADAKRRSPTWRNYPH